MSNVIRLSDLPAAGRKMATAQGLIKAAPKKTEAQLAIEKAQREALENSLWAQLTKYLPASTGVVTLFWERGYRFCSWRNWEADFAETTHKVLVECQGGTWIHGSRSHAGGLGTTIDAERMIIAQALGYSILFVTKDMIDSGLAVNLIEKYFNIRRHGGRGFPELDDADQ